MTKETIKNRLNILIEKDRVKGLQAYGCIEMDMPKDVFGHYNGAYTDGLIIYYPSKYRYGNQYSILEDTSDLHIKFDTLDEVSSWIFETYYQ